MPMRITGMNSGLDTDAMVQELVSAYKKKGEKTTQTKTKLEWKQDIWKDLNKKIKAFNSKVQNLKYSSSYNLKKTTSSDESKATVIAGDNAVKGNQTLKVKSIAQSTYFTSGEIKTTDGGKVKGDTLLSDIGIRTGGKITVKNNVGDPQSFDARPDMTINELVNQFKTAGIDANFDESSGRLFLTGKDTGWENGFDIAGSPGVLGKLGLRDLTDSEINAIRANAGSEEEAQREISRRSVSKIYAKDAEIELNGATFHSNNNNFNINGLSITVKDVTQGDEKITLSTETDTEGIYNQIKDLIKEYSSLINELDKLYNAELAKGYEPLSDDEKDAMSEKEVEKWEQKIKDSLLRRDSNVASISSAMKQSALKSYNGLTLADFGIATLGYFNSEDNERNALHIDGDEDDDAVSSNTNKLKKMIADDPDAVSGFFTAFLQELGDRFTKLSGSSANRSYGNFYDDKRVESDLKKYTSKVSDWEEYVKKVEDKYYKQFSNMEKQLAKLNSTQQSMANYFPTN